MDKRFISYFTFLITLFISINASYAQLNTVDFNQLENLQSIEQKKVVVFLHTDWCKFCLKMKNTSLNNDSVISSLNKNFYFVELDGESTEDIHYGGHTFKFKPNGLNTGTHELAEQLGTINSKLNYPTISVINPKNEIVFQHGGFMSTEELLVLFDNL